MTTSLCNIKAQFQYPGRLDFLLGGKIARYLFVCKILSMHFVWANHGANQLLPIVCHQKYSLCEPSLPLHEVGVSTGAATPVQWKLRSLPAPCVPATVPLCADLWGCWVLMRMHRRCHCTTSEMGISQAEAQGRRCISPV